MNANKMLFGILIAVLFFLPVALAESTNETIEVPAEETIVEGLPDAGVTPDSPFYGLERAMERIQLALTFDKADKAKLGLEHANERLAEVQQMVQEKKLDQAAKAQKAHDESLAEVEVEVADLSESNATDEAEAVAEIEAGINEHRMYVEKLDNIMIKTKGTLTAEQQATVDEMVAGMGNSTAKLKIEIQNKKEETSVKVKLQTEKSAEEVETETEETEKTNHGNNVKSETEVEETGVEPEEAVEVEETEPVEETEVEIENETEVASE
ncbi:MAG: DUF5667 domain-containing protein [Candidatus Nanoarchaeia archaeon]|nr:DUF5667 domain-containing protein [Candidatus Nanoarchaeia archaeon]